MAYDSRLTGSLLLCSDAGMVIKFPHQNFTELEISLRKQIADHEPACMHVYGSGSFLPA
jgi:hypothetical protein